MAVQLSEFERQQTTLSEIFSKYATLMEDFKRLRSDYEEERDSRERYKQMARGQERNPFVLVRISLPIFEFSEPKLCIYRCWGSHIG